MGEGNKTHAEVSQPFSAIMQALEESIYLRGDLPYISVQEQLKVLRDLASFPLGQFFLTRKGADGFWTDYIINYPNREGSTNDRRSHSSLSRIEKFILTQCPLTLATRERFKIFQNEAQKRLREGIIALSIPCGIMRDLLSLDFSQLSSFHLVGVDFDPNALSLAKNLAQQSCLESHCTFLEEDAWKLKLDQPADLITSSGLNVYLTEQERVLSLYANFYHLLKKDGVLITSILTTPPYISPQSEWILDLLPQSDIWMEKFLFQDLLGAKWRNFRSIREACEDFQAVGFKHTKIIFDKYHIFPTIVATK